jgi:hypothetical protein
MKDMAKMNHVPESVRRVVETMALSKSDMVQALRHMDWRERALMASTIADRVMSDFIKANPDYEINVTQK